MAGYEMSVDQVRLRALQIRLKQAGERGLTRELNAALKEAAAPVAEAERQAAENLPSSGALFGRPNGGLRQALSSGVRIRTSSSNRKPGVSVFIRKNAVQGWIRPGLDTVKDRGWRHPVFGNRNVWVAQIGQPGWWYRTAKPFLPKVRDDVAKAVDRVFKKLAH